LFGTDGLGGVVLVVAASIDGFFGYNGWIKTA
jgi:hypothetical protein